MATLKEEEPATIDVSKTLDSMPPVAPGAEKELADHKDDPIKLEPYNPEQRMFPVEHISSIDKPSSPPHVSTDEDKGEGSDDEVEIVGVKSSIQASS